MANKTHCDLVAPGSEFDANYGCKISTTKIDAAGDEQQVDEADYPTYDIGHDMFVMQVEVGCPYHRRGCSGGERADGACIGNTVPNGNVTADRGTVFYDRSTGKCWHNTNTAQDWSSFGPAQHLLNSEGSLQFHPLLTNGANSKNPPLGTLRLGNISDEDIGICQNIAEYIDTSVLGAVSVDAGGFFDASVFDNRSGIKENFFSIKVTTEYQYLQREKNRSLLCIGMKVLIFQRLKLESP